MPRPLPMRPRLITGEKGAAIVEVTMAILLLGIMIAGLSQLLTSQIQSRRDYMKEQLALLAVSNQMERLICLVKDDEWGTACPTTAKDSTTEAAALTPSLSGDLSNMCPACQMRWTVGCVESGAGAAVNKWLLDAWVPENTVVQASLSRHVFHE